MLVTWFFSFSNNSSPVFSSLQRVTLLSRKLERNGRVHSQVRDYNSLCNLFPNGILFSSVVRQTNLRQRKCYKRCLKMTRIRPGNSLKPMIRLLNLIPMDSLLTPVLLETPTLYLSTIFMAWHLLKRSPSCMMKTLLYLKDLKKRI